MTCSWCEERFEPLLEGELTPADQARLHAHVATCAPCRSLLDELRVVDALLLRPAAIDPGPNFTAKTMEDVRTLPPPRPRRSQLPALLTCYVVGAWGAVAAGALLAPQFERALGSVALDAGRTFVFALGGMFHVATHLGDRGELGSWTTLAGGVVVADALLLGAVAFVVRGTGNRRMERQRS